MEREITCGECAKSIAKPTYVKHFKEKLGPFCSEKCAKLAASKLSDEQLAKKGFQRCSQCEFWVSEDEGEGEYVITPDGKEVLVCSEECARQAQNPGKKKRPKCTTCFRIQDPSETYIVVPGYETKGVFCSSKCAVLAFRKITPNEEEADERERPFRELLDNGENIPEADLAKLNYREALYDLEYELLKNRAAVINDAPIQTMDTTDYVQIEKALRLHGVAHVKFSGGASFDVLKKIKNKTAELIVDTFHVPEDVFNDEEKEERYQNRKTQILSTSRWNYKDLSQWWASETIETHKMNFSKSITPQMEFLLAKSKNKFKNEITKDNIHIKNPLAAMSSVYCWEYICESFEKIFPLFRPGKTTRAVATEQSIQFCHEVSYDPQPITYHDINPRRTNACVCNDQGLLLFVVPGSHKTVIRDRVLELTGLDTHMPYKSDDFMQLRQKHPEVYSIMHRYAIAYKGTVLLMHVPGVWYFEALVGRQADDGLKAPGLMSPALAEDNFTFDYEMSKSATKEEAIVFRVFCDIARVPFSQENVDMLILFAYMREHGWAMDPFSDENAQNRHDIFFNDKQVPKGANKGFSAYEEFQTEFKLLIPGFGDIDGEWQLVKKKITKKKFVEQKTVEARKQMKKWLWENVPHARLYLYGLFLSKDFPEYSIEQEEQEK